MKILTQTSLYYAEGRSDKEYHVDLVAAEGGHVVNFRYGRRGSALTVGTKTSVPVDFAQAKMIFDKLVKEKTAKGYTADVSGVAYQGTEHAGRQTGFVPQLLNPITESEALCLLIDDHWAAQEKMDGERRMAEVRHGKVSGANRKGLIVPLPQTVADELQPLETHYGEIRVDGELIGERLYVFDLHFLHGMAIQHFPWIERMSLVKDVLSECRYIKAVPVAETSDEKRRLWKRVHEAHGEGVVFKRLNAQVTEGRPNAGGDWLKFKFTTSASCYVVGINADKRSVRLGMIESSDYPITRQGMVPVGNVTIPPNHAVPNVGEIVEVEYLYAYLGGSLYQPVYRGKRGDLGISACTTRQLKYKPEGRDDDEA